ncbi:MAG: hypothetical protein JNL58_27640 [Planctomyces sp.]|nr:hypothetical protein [Planctomyces sp.]
MNEQTLPRVPVLAAIVGLILTACLLVRMAPSEESLQGHQWVTANLSSTEARTVRRLAEQIAQANELKRANQNADRSSNADQSQMLTEQATALSIRLSAALAVLLRTEWGIDPVPWVQLAAQRERLARRNIEQRLLKFEFREREFPGLQITVRGPQWLQTECGTELLSEVTGVGFWQFHDSDIPAETQFSDTDVPLLLNLPGLERLWAENSQLTDQGVSDLSQLPRLTDFHLAGCIQLTDTAIHSLARSDLRLLDVSSGPHVTDAGIRSLQNCNRLQELGLNQTKISSESLSVIARLHPLKVLKLDRTNVLKGLEQLGTLAQLEVLSLSHLGSTTDPIPSTSLNFLTRLKRLRVLDLSETAVDRIQLSNLHHLEQLSLGHTSLRKLSLRTIPRLQELSTGYPSTRKDIQLESVDLHGLNDLSRLTLHVHSPPACSEFARGLCTLSSLKSLYLPVAAMSDRLAEELGRLPKLENLILEDADLSDGQLQLILYAKRLRTLDCGGPGLTRFAVQNVLNSDRLEGLQLRRLRLNDETPWRTSALLQRLVLWDCDIQSLSLAMTTSLSQFGIFLSRIERLHVHQCPELTRTEFLRTNIGNFQINDCPKLASVFAGFTRFDSVRIEKLPELERLTIQEHSSVRELRLSQLPKLRSCSFWAAEIEPDLLAGLQDILTLTELDVSGTPLRDDAALRISKMSQLRRLSASSHFSRAGLNQLHELSNLKELLLYWTDKADWTKEEAVQMFRHKTSVTVFP